MIIQPYEKVFDTGFPEIWVFSSALGFKKFESS